MSIILIAAMDPKRVIGKDGKLPWHIPEDFKLFKQFTSGNTIIMGRKTFESLGKPLPNRHNIVVSSTTSHIPGAEVCKDLSYAIQKAKAYGKDIYICGGANIYGQSLAFADKMYLSFVKKEYPGDTFFPLFDAKVWEEESRKEYEDFHFVVYARSKF